MSKGVIEKNTKTQVSSILDSECSGFAKKVTVRLGYSTAPASYIQAIVTLYDQSKDGGFGRKLITFRGIIDPESRDKESKELKENASVYVGFNSFEALEDAGIVVKDVPEEWKRARVTLGKLKSRVEDIELPPLDYVVFMSKVLSGGNIKPSLCPKGTKDISFATFFAMWCYIAGTSSVCQYYSELKDSGAKIASLTEEESKLLDEKVPDENSPRYKEYATKFEKLSNKYHVQNMDEDKELSEDSLIYFFLVLARTLERTDKFEDIKKKSAVTMAAAVGISKDSLYTELFSSEDPSRFKEVMNILPGLVPKMMGAFVAKKNMGVSRKDLTYAQTYASFYGMTQFKYVLYFSQLPSRGKITLAHVDSDVLDDMVTFMKTYDMMIKMLGHNDVQYFFLHHGSVFTQGSNWPNLSGAALARAVQEEPTMKSYLTDATKERISRWDRLVKKDFAVSGTGLKMQASAIKAIYRIPQGVKLKDLFVGIEDIEALAHLEE